MRSINGDMINTCKPLVVKSTVNRPLQERGVNEEKNLIINLKYTLYLVKIWTMYI